MLLGLVLALFVFALGTPRASAYVALPPGVTPVSAPPAGGALVKLSNGEYALYGPGGEEAQVMKLYSAEAEETLVRRGTGLDLDSGVTGQDASAVEGSSSADVEAVDAMHSELVGDGAEDAANGVVNDVTDGSRALGVLPDLGEIGGALSGGVLIAGSVVAVVSIATGIDEVFGLPSLLSSAPANVPTSHGYVEEFSDAGEQWVESVPCDSAIAGGEGMVYRTNTDHCMTLYELVRDTFVPIEPECVERFGKTICESLGSVLRRHGTLIDPEAETAGIARWPNAEALPNGVIAIFRDLDREIRDEELPHTTGSSENFSHNPPVPSVATPEPLHEPVPPLSLPEVPPELLNYIGSVDPGLGHGEGGAVPNPVAVNRLAKALGENNPESESSPKERKEIARGCLDSSTNAGESGPSDCEHLPIFWSGSDVPSATRHDMKALAEHPIWGELDYESAAVKEEHVARNWFKGIGGCSSEAASPTTESCDEFPFFATQQGGPLASPQPSLEYIDTVDNRKEGGKYGAFISSCHLATRVHFIFAAIPPSLGIPTGYLCNE